MTRLQESKGRYSLTLPLGLVKAKKWAKGQELLVTFDERTGNLVVREVPKS